MVNNRFTMVKEFGNLPLVSRLGEHIRVKFPVVCPTRDGRKDGKVKSDVEMVRPDGRKEFIKNIVRTKGTGDEKDI